VDAPPPVQQLDGIANIANHQPFTIGYQAGEHVTLALPSHTVGFWQTLKDLVMFSTNAW